MPAYIHLKKFKKAKFKKALPKKPVEPFVIYHFAELIDACNYGAITVFLALMIIHLSKKIFENL